MSTVFTSGSQQTTLVFRFSSVRFYLCYVVLKNVRSNFGNFLTNHAYTRSATGKVKIASDLGLCRTSRPTLVLARTSHARSGLY